jgi:Uncharacterised nucleotidyltransferase
MTDSLRFRKMIVRLLIDTRIDHRAESEEEWRRNLRWLDRSGLALPLAARLKSLKAGSVVPIEIVTALKSRLADNQKRMQRMIGFFQEAVQALDASGARWCCVKGFSLIPDCLDNIRERHQVDLDFLVAPHHLTRAQGAIEALGYHAQQASSSGEMRLVKPWKKHIGVDGYLYQLPEAPPIELHTRVWEPENDEFMFESLSGFLEATEIHQIDGFSFPRLRHSHQFVYLLIHIFRHLTGSWARLLSLYEIHRFISSRMNDDDLWTEAVSLISEDRQGASACALILGLVHSTFPLELPQPLRNLCAQNLSMDSALWIDQWSEAWLFTDPPGNKLSLLVQRQFWPNGRAWHRYLRRRLLPLRTPHPLSVEIAGSTKNSLAYRLQDTRYKAGRAWFHLRSDCEYLLARLRWKQHIQRGMRSTHLFVDGH